LAVIIINFAKRSLQLELYEFADFLKIPYVTKQAFSKARKKLSPMLFQLLNQKLISEFYTDNAIETYKGLRLFAVDGSTLRLPSSKELYNEYGYDRLNDSIPMAKSSIMYDVLNNLTVHASLNPYYSNERDLAIEHIDAFKKSGIDQGRGNLWLFDRGYPSAHLMFYLNKAGEHFLMRITSNFLAETNVAIMKEESADSIITISALKVTKYLRPESKKYIQSLGDDAKLQFRLLIFDLGNNKKEFIITSLINQNEFSYDEIFKLYGMRWNIEEGFKFYKAIAQIENFSGKSKLAIEQDFYATVFACNLSALLMQESQDELRQSEHEKDTQYEYKVNRNILIGIIKNEIIEIFLNNHDLNEYCESLKNRIKKNLVPIRPNRLFPEQKEEGHPRLIEEHSNGTLS
jgi:hypothetical protein